MRLHESGGAADRRAAAALWLLVPFVWLLAAVVASSRGGMLILADGTVQPIPWTELFVGNLFVFGWWALMSPAIAVVVRTITRSSASLPARILAHLAAATVFVTVDFALLVYVRPAAARFAVAPTWSGLRSALTQAVAAYAIIAAVSVAIALHARARDATRLEGQLFAARLQVLRAQLHPHFLFNALHAISTLVDVRPHDARRMLARLGELLRAAVEFSDASEVPLTRELEWIEQYVELQQIRYEEQLDVDVEVAPEAMRAMVPPLLLQPLVENSIKHGVEKHAGGGRIAIAATRAGDTLTLRVRDNGPGPGNASTNGVGLRNTRARLETLYGDASSVTLRAAEGGGAEAIVEIPFRESAP
jgi:signal transduction histidine kinase